jgi:hypothetical protein
MMLYHEINRVNMLYNINTFWHQKENQYFYLNKNWTAHFEAKIVFLIKLVEDLYYL